MHVIIVGAGLGGLTLALALARAGSSATLLERTGTFREFGAGVQLAPNGTKALFSLGLETPVRRMASTPDAVRVNDHETGRLLLETPLGEAAEARWGAPYLQVHRADLHALLLRTLRDTGRAEVRLGARVVGVAEGAALLEDGSRVKGEALIACDGVRSAVREAVFGPTPARFTREVAWRGVLPAERVGEVGAMRSAQVLTGPGRHFVCYALRQGRLINFIAVTEEARWTTESWSEPGRKVDLAAAFSGWPDPVGPVIEAADQIWRWALFDRPPLRRWSRGSTSLLGDAAHPMLPFLAQGAGMALEDAVVLARCLTLITPVERALRRYEGARRLRTAKTQAWSRRNATLFHLPSTLAAGVFQSAAALDRLRRVDSRQRFDWLYGYDAANAVI